MDSDNDGTIGDSDDAIENDYLLPGKVIKVNDDDTNRDSIPDWAQGFKREGSTIPSLENIVSGEMLTSLSVRLGSNLDFSQARIRLIYNSAADPATVTYTGSGVAQDPYVYHLNGGTGRLRVWTKSGSEQRDARNAEVNGGTFVSSNMSYSASQLGLVNGIGSLWIEAVRPSEYTGQELIELQVDPDGDGPLGFIFKDEVRLTAVPNLIRVDGNRDNAINFDSADDKDYSFWVNNDIDRINTAGTLTDILITDELGYYDHILGRFVAAGRRDNSDNYISSTRDLEDLFRVSLALPGLLDTLDGWELQLKWEPEYDAENVSRLNVYHVTEEQADSYLTDSTVAAQVASKSADFTFGPNQSVFVLTPTMMNGSRSTFLVEGLATANGKLYAEWAIQDKVVVRESVSLKFKSIRDFYEIWTMSQDGVPFGDNTNPPDPKVTSYPSTVMRTADSGNLFAEPELSDDYILFVHGWRMKITERRSYGETAFKRSYWQGFKGRFGIYSWPTEWINLDSGLSAENAFKAAIVDSGNYARSEEVAYHSAPAIATLFEALKFTYGTRGGKISVFAHSMGNMVVGEVLKRLGDQNKSNVIDTYILTQAAKGADYYKGDPASVYPDTYSGQLGGDNPRFSNINVAASKIVNFYNSNDTALNLWEYGNWSKVDPLVNVMEQGGRGFGSDVYFGHPQWGFYRANNPIFDKLDNAPLTWGNAPYEIMAYLAKEKRPPVGRVKLEEGPITINISLAQLFDIGVAHSGQWEKDLPKTREYWLELMDQSGFQVFQ